MTKRPNSRLIRRQIIAMAIPRTRFTAIAVFSLVCVALLSVGTSPAMATDQLTDGSSSKQLRLQTVNSLPYHQLNAQTKEKISDILAKPNIYRRLPVTAINADPDYFRFLVRYPEVIVNIWQMMGVTKMATDRIGPYTVDTDDGAGTLSSLELVYGSDNLHIFYGSGSYEGPILKRKLRGKAVLVLRSETSKDSNGNPISTSQLDIFLKVENATAGLIAKTIQPLVGTTADHNFVESLKFVERLNETTSKNGPGVQKMGQKLDIDDSVRQRFNEVVDVVFQRSINSTQSSDRLSTRSDAMETSLQTRAVAGQSYATPQPHHPAYNSNPQQNSEAAERMWQARGQQSHTGYQQNTPNSRPPQRGAVHARLNDLGQSNPASTYGRQSGQPQLQRAGQPQTIVNGGQLPARGFQAPSYATPGNYSFQYQQRNLQAGQGSTAQGQSVQGQPVQASYNHSQDQNTQPANVWRARR